MDKPNKTEIVLALDPSITCTGYVLMNQDGDNLIAGGLIKPKHRHERMKKITCICDCVEKLIREYNPDVAVVEVTTGKVNRARHKGGGAGLAVYGMCVGAVWQKLVSIKTIKTVTVYENDWTPGKGGKVRRRLDCSVMFPGLYDYTKDPGGDMADAIMIGQWYFAKRNICDTNE